MARVVALMDDLFFQMKLAETAKHLGVELKVAATAEALQGLRKFGEGGRRVSGRPRFRPRNKRIRADQR